MRLATDGLSRYEFPRALLSPRAYECLRRSFLKPRGAWNASAEPLDGGRVRQLTGARRADGKHASGDRNLHVEHLFARWRGEGKGESVILSDLVGIIAIILAPLLALNVQRRLDAKREQIQRRVAVFRTLMATRGTILSFQHVEALNSIDVEFYGVKAVIEAWRRYYNHLSQTSSQDESVVAAWTNRQQELLTDLLHQMAVALQYNFDKSVIERASYSPIAYGNAEQETQIIRGSLAQLLPALLKREYAVPIDLASKSENENEGNQ